MRGHRLAPGAGERCRAVITVRQCCQHCQVPAEVAGAVGGDAIAVSASAAARISLDQAASIALSGVWRSLVARSVRVGEAPSSNLGTPIGTHIGQAQAGEAPVSLAPADASCLSLCSVNR
jgi:hypothetical protein